MKLWVSRGVLVAALIAVGVWGWGVLFPSPERIIRRQLTDLARTACIKSNEGMLIKLAKAQKLASFFTVDAAINVDVPGHSAQSLSGRDDIMRVAGVARAAVSSLKVEFLDVGVTVNSDGQSGQAHFTVKADVPGESTPQVEEVEASFK